MTNPEQLPSGLGDAPERKPLKPRHGHATAHRVLTMQLPNKPTQEEAEAVLGGPVEVLNMDDGCQMLFCPRGEEYGFDRNPPASRRAGRDIYGNVLIQEKEGTKWTTE